MSWNFSVTGNNAQDSFEKFQECLWKNGQHVPFKMGDDINSAAARLAEIAAKGEEKLQPSRVRRVTLSSNGHFNDTGDGNVSVTLHIMPEESLASALSDDQNGM